MLDRKRQEFSQHQRSQSSSRFSGLFKGILGKKQRKFVVVVIDDEEKQVKEICALVQQHPLFEPVSASDGVEGLALLKKHGDDVRLCLCDMILPGFSGIELLNRVRADPTLNHVTFALMTEFSSGTTKKTLSHFQVKDDRGESVDVLIKPLHVSLVHEILSDTIPDAKANKKLGRTSSVIMMGKEEEKAQTPQSKKKSGSHVIRREPMVEAEASGRVVRSTSEWELSSEAKMGRRNSLTSSFPRSVSSFDCKLTEDSPKGLREQLAMKELLEVTPRTSGASPRGSPRVTPRHSPRSSPRHSPAGKSPPSDGSLGGEDVVPLNDGMSLVRSKRMSRDEMFFNSINSLPRETQSSSRSVSVDQLNWDEVKNV